MKKPAVLLMGPTASGKTAIAVELVGRMPLEIVSVDSALVFRHMDIGTAKPDAATLSSAPHHLIDLIDPVDAYSAGRFVTDAERAMDEITSRGKIPLLVGGTMLYFKALQEGLNTLPRAEAEIRNEIELEAAMIGWPKMHLKLSKIDPVTALRLEPNDSQRIGRALEIWRITGQTMSELLREQKTGGADYRFVKIALAPSARSELHQRIATRFEGMLRAGLVDELAMLKQRFALDASMPSMRAVGYRQTWSHLNGEIDRDQLLEQGICATRQLAKRQLTWIRSMQDLETFDCLETGLARKIADFVDGSLTNHSK